MQLTLIDGVASMELGVNITPEFDTSHRDLDAIDDGVSTGQIQAGNSLCS